MRVRPLESVAILLLGLTLGIPANAEPEPRSPAGVIEVRTLSNTFRPHYRPGQTRKRGKTDTILRYEKPLEFRDHNMVLRVKAPGKRKSFVSFELKF
jgi:hypothetical protein